VRGVVGVSAARYAKSPSAWSRRAPVVTLALIGCLIATYLGMYQIGEIQSVWDPIFGSGSEEVLTSWLSRSLPVPDALLGAVVYGLDALLGTIGGDNRWREAPWLVVGHGVVLGGLVLAGLALVAVQALVLRTGCTLCLASAAISFASAWLAKDEVVAAIWRLRNGTD
jgi:uncharacterized membrane protein